MWCMNRDEQQIILDGQAYSKKDLHRLESLPHTEALKAFLNEWFLPDDTILVRTSGSTGTPKSMYASKTNMLHSARITCETLGLHPGDRILVCMPLTFIAGIMMIVRALLARLDIHLVAPSGQPFAAALPPIRFAAMVPLQVYHSLHCPEARQRLWTTDILLIGGGALDPEIEKDLQSFPGAAYASYGMTETLSHIALRRIQGDRASSHYRPLPGINLSLSEKGTLVIDAPQLCATRLITNDCATLYPDGSFTIQGRADTIINSGGLKLQAEELERLLKPLLPQPFVITSRPHPQFGEAVTLLVTGEIDIQALSSSIAESIPKTMRPKYIRRVATIPTTESGKIQRAACKELALNTQSPEDLPNTPPQ